LQLGRLLLEKLILGLQIPSQPRILDRQSGMAPQLLQQTDILVAEATFRGRMPQRKSPNGPMPTRQGNDYDGFNPELPYQRSLIGVWEDLREGVLGEFRKEDRLTGLEDGTAGIKRGIREAVIPGIMQLVSIRICMGHGDPPQRTPRLQEVDDTPVCHLGNGQICQHVERSLQIERGGE